MANKKTVKGDLKQEPIKPDTIIEQEKIIEKIIDPKPKSFIEPDQILSDFESGDPKFTQEEYLQQVEYYAGELLVSLEGIFIGGHAAQIKDQLFIALNNYRNGN